MIAVKLKTLRVGTMQVITFVRDLCRFRREGLLFTVGYLLFARIELVFWYGGLAILLGVFRSEPKMVIVLCLAGIVLTLRLLVDFTVRLLTPVLVGSFAIGRPYRNIVSSRFSVNFCVRIWYHLVSRSTPISWGCL